MGQLDLVCQPDYMIGLIGSATFVGWALMTLVIPPMADKYGRRNIFLVTSLVAAIIMAAQLILAKNIYVTFVLMLLIGMTFPGNTSIAFVYMCEFLTPDQQVVFSTVCMFFDCTVFLQFTIYYWLVTNNYIWLTSFGAILTIVGTLGAYFFMPESPLWLLTTNQHDKAHESIKKILDFNGVPHSKEDIQRELEQDEFNECKSGRPSNQQESDDELISRESSNTKLTNNSLASSISVSAETEIFFYLRNWDIRVNLGVMSYVWSAYSFSVYLLYGQLKYLPGNIYHNAIAVASAQLTACVVAGLITKRTGLKCAMSFMFACSLAGGLLILLSEKISEKNLMPLFVLLTKFGITGLGVIAYTSSVQLFPTLFSGTAIGICNLLCRVLTISAFVIAEMEPPIPISILILVHFLGFFLVQFIRTEIKGSPAQPKKSD